MRLSANSPLEAVKGGTRGSESNTVEMFNGTFARHIPVHGYTMWNQSNSQSGHDLRLKCRLLRRNIATLHRSAHCVRFIPVTVFTVATAFLSERAPRVRNEGEPMKQSTRRIAGLVAAASAVTLIAAGCSDDNDSNSAASSPSSAAEGTSGMEGMAGMSGSAAAAGASVELKAADGSTVKLTGPIAAKYNAATEQQKTDLGAPSTGAQASGTGENGVVFQQFAGGVITAKNSEESTPAYITWGKIRDAWNVKRDAEGNPSADGKGGSQGPLGTATSDETDENGVKTSTFEHGKITWTASTDKVEVTVNGKVVPGQ